jgi:AbrB family looped-hinge helix DNA binding protein
MKTYHVTRKFQITIPKRLAKELRLNPGDTVVFQKAGNAVLVKKSRTQVRDRIELMNTVEAFARDMEKVGKHTVNAERAITANLSRHIRPQP